MHVREKDAHLPHVRAFAAATEAAVQSHLTTP